MARYSQWLRNGCLFLILATCTCVSVIREKGRKTVIACGFETYEQSVLWEVRGGNGFINVASCTFGNSSCVDYMPQLYRGEVEKMSDGVDGYLWITSVRINETEFSCLSRHRRSTYILEVYARPSNLLCYPVELDYTKKNLQFRCTAKNVYPSVSAVLFIRGVDLSRQDVLSMHCSNEETGSLNLDGYSAECIWRISATKLEPIKYKYYVKMFPNLSNSTGISVPNVVSQDYTLQLSSPVAVIDYSHCPVGPGVVDDKIINGSASTCRCVLSSPGFPSGQARWYTHNGNQSLGRDDTTDGSSTLVIDTNIPGQVYQCRAESPLNSPLNWGPVYTPVFTARPSNPVCDPVELDHTKKSLEFKCSARNIYPSVKATLYIKGMDLFRQGVLSTHCLIEELDSLTHDGYSTECTWSISAEKLGPVKYKYYVKMFPNLSNSTRISVPNVVSQDYTLQLSSPIPAIDYSHCPVGPGVVDGKIVTDSTATCRCVLESPGFPSGQARWYTHNSNHSLGTDNTVDGSSTLVINTNTSDQSFQCRAESPLNNIHTRGPVYTPIFAKPSSCPETNSLRIELVAGILAGSVLLTLIIAAVLWKWRSHKRQSADRTSVAYSRMSLDAASVVEVLDRF